MPPRGLDMRPRCVCPMSRPTRAIFALLVLWTLAACTSADDLPSAGAPETTNARFDLSSTPDRGRDDRLQGRGTAAVALAPDRLLFTAGGSGTCPPNFSQARREGDTLVLIDDRAPFAGGFCTSDHVFYSIEAVLPAPLLADSGLTHVRIDAGPRVPLRRSDP